MWYAIGHIAQDNPQAIVQVAKQIKTVNKNRVQGLAVPVLSPVLALAAPLPQAPQAPKARTVSHAFRLPANTPCLLRKQVYISKSDQSSEFHVLASVARQLHVHFVHTGPDYALFYTRVPFAKSVSAYEMLSKVGHSYVPGTVTVTVLPGGQTSISANNRTPGSVR
jgi:hypothetical protein